MPEVWNAMSVDLEDWFCVYNLKNHIRRDDWDKCESRVVNNTRRLMDLFRKHKVKSTFFVLGWIADHFPFLIQEICKDEHEIACHGYSHSLLTEMSEESFSQDLTRALTTTRSISQQQVVGFRAPSFSITPKTTWAFDILTQNGILYDSSVYPIGFHPDYGMPDSPLSVYRVNDALVEFPMSCAVVLNRRIPCSGGGYFRILPYSVSQFLFRRINEKERPFVFYLHPWEIDPEQPRLPLAFVKRFRHYHNLEKTFARMDKLLSEFRFTTMRNVLEI